MTKHTHKSLTEPLLYILLYKEIHTTIDKKRENRARTCEQAHARTNISIYKYLNIHAYVRAIKYYIAYVRAIRYFINLHTCEDSAIKLDRNIKKKKPQVNSTTARIVNALLLGDTT